MTVSYFNHSIDLFYFNFRSLSGRVGNIADKPRVWSLGLRILLLLRIEYEKVINE